MGASYPLTVYYKTQTKTTFYPFGSITATDTYVALK